MAGRLRSRWFLAGLSIAVLASSSRADDPLLLRESLEKGGQFHVSARTELSGQMTLPPAKDQKAKLIPFKGESALDYDELIVAKNKDGLVDKTLRIYRKAFIHRMVDQEPQESRLRDAVRRLVIMRHSNLEVPFSPDGPLTWNEVDLIRTDVFTPALVGLLPEKAVAVGERWKASLAAVQELTDMQRIEEGDLQCRLDRVVEQDKRRLARVEFTGSVRGLSDDGPNQQNLSGYLDFDLTSNYVAYVYLKGTHLLLDKDGKENGKLEGRFILSREVDAHCKEFADDAVKNLKMEPDAELMLLLYDNAEQGVRFLYPRRWRLAEGAERQLTLDGPEGSGLRLTIDERTPATAQFQKESRDWFLQRKGKILKSDPPERFQTKPTEIDRFTLEVNLKDEFITMVYYVTHQAQGSAAIAARLGPADRDTAAKEVETIAKSLFLRKPVKK